MVRRFCDGRGVASDDEGVVSDASREREAVTPRRCRIVTLVALRAGVGVLFASRLKPPVAAPHP